jgi:hypothetical protein
LPLFPETSFNSSKVGITEMKKSIVVSGDLVWDTHIARLQPAREAYYLPHLQSHLKNGYGGAWYLRDMIEGALEHARRDAEDEVERAQADLENLNRQKASDATLKKADDKLKKAKLYAIQFEASVVAPEKVSHTDIENETGASGGIAKGFSLWEWFDSKEKPAKARIGKDGTIAYKWREGEAQLGAWRIREFLGCQQANWQNPASNIDWRDASKQPDVLVIDDLGLGFATHTTCWPNFLSERATPPAQILIKATPPFNTPLWQMLLKPEWASRLTVVVSAEGLRDCGAQLSQGLSWDQTVQDVKAEFMQGGLCWSLHSCLRVVVGFGRSGVAVFSRVPRSPGEERTSIPALQFERFVLDPAQTENSWETDQPGTTFGVASVITAMFATHSLMIPQPSTHLTVSRGLFAARELHRLGGGNDEKGFALETKPETIFAVDAKLRPEGLFVSAFPRELLDEPVLARKEDLPPLENQTLLTDALGLTPTFLSVAAQGIVRYGKERFLASVPRIECGQYYSVDRDEIERLNTVRNLILEYKSSVQDKRPLSLAVFGAPGSGKSFAIKQLSETLFGKDRAVLEFNLSQFEDLEALHEAFHIVRDKSVQGQLPLVFWDEFDAMRDGVSLGWLKEFLSPMQDAQFVTRGIGHPFGKCIFVFAGGTSSTFEEFVRPNNPAFKSARDEAEVGPSAEHKRFKEVKGPDFVSRLRGYVNIKGPNPTSDRGDEVYVIRRALLLRSLVERHHRGVIDPITKELSISPTVLDAFLRVGDGLAGKGYLHGARSMEAIISLSSLHNARHFGPSELPARQVVELHASPDFFPKTNDNRKYHLSPNDIEVLAKMVHDGWRKEKEAQGYKPGPRDDNANPPTNPRLVDYAQLTEEQKESNRLPARLTSLRLEALGYWISKGNCAEEEVLVFDDQVTLETLARSEHRRWTREKLLEGISYCSETNDKLLLHKDIQKFEGIDTSEKRLDMAIIKAMIETIIRFAVASNLKLVRATNRKVQKSRT